MGAEHPKPKKQLNKVDLEIVCDKVYQFLNLNRGRKIDQLALKEREVKEKLAKSKHIYDEVFFDITSIVTLFNWIQASRIIMKNVQFLKERSMQITSAANERNSDKIAPLKKYIINVIWSEDRLNLKAIGEFNRLIYAFFGSEFIRLAKEGHGVDEDLFKCFYYIEPTPKQVGDYLINMIKRYNFTHINIDKEIPAKYKDPSQSTPPAPPSNSAPFHPSNPPNMPPPNQSYGNNDMKFDYSQQNQATGFFDDPNNYAGQKNWSKIMGGSFQKDNNMNFNPNDFQKLAPSKIDDMYENPHNNSHQNQPQPPNPHGNDMGDDLENMINSLHKDSVKKNGNEIVNPSMSYMKIGESKKPEGYAGIGEPDNDDFDALINSLQGPTHLNEMSDQKPNPAPTMRGPPTRRNKAKKPIPDQPEAYQYSCEVDQDAEEKYYEELSFEFRIEEMRRIKV